MFYVLVEDVGKAIREFEDEQGKGAKCAFLNPSSMKELLIEIYTRPDLKWIRFIPDTDPKSKSWGLLWGTMLYSRDDLKENEIELTLFIRYRNIATEYGVSIFS